MAFAMSINAQSVSEQMTNLDKLCVKLEKALSKAPKPSGVGDVDTYVDACKLSAKGQSKLRPNSRISTSAI